MLIDYVVSTLRHIALNARERAASAPWVGVYNYLRVDHQNYPAAQIMRKRPKLQSRPVQPSLLPVQPVILFAQVPCPRPVTCKESLIPKVHNSSL